MKKFQEEKEKIKISVYAIAKNEEQFADRWFNSMEEADEIYVLDTGSTDQTVEKLKKRGVHVTVKKIDPWRFDVARNESLALVPEDVTLCVCTDLDEVFEKGWRKKLENLWEEGVTRICYNYNWSFDAYGKPAINFYIDKIHIRNGYQWTHPVHEVLTYLGSNETFVTTDEITLNHYPDSKKSRSSYLPLLELSVLEDPEDDRNMHYLGREYMYYGKWNECIDTLIKHLNLKRATWHDERCASMRFIARAYQHLNRPLEAKMWLDFAIKEAPYLRDPYLERALLEYREKNWQQVEFYCKEALKITSHKKSYINEPFSWDYTVYDLLSLACYYQGNFEDACKYGMEAVKMAPEEKRVQQNLECFLKEKGEI